MPTEFTPIAALAGGALIGLAATLLLWLTGRIAGISGILAGAAQSAGPERHWRVAFLGGLLLGAAGWFWLAPLAGADVPAVREGFSWPVLAAAGLLVGLGTRLGSGCTSGHGICGLARLSPRSAVAVAVFMASAMVTVSLVRHVGG